MSKMARPEIVLVIFSFIGGFVDSAGYIKLYGIFTSSVTGNIIVACSAFQNYEPYTIAKVIITIAFAVGALLTSLAALTLRIYFRNDAKSVCHLLTTVQFIFLAIGMMSGIALQHKNTRTMTYVTGSILACTMGLQNSAVLISYPNSPSTTALTALLARCAGHGGTIIFGKVSRASDRGENNVEGGTNYDVALEQLLLNLSMLLGFCLGAGVGSWLVSLLSFWCFSFPLGLLLLVQLLVFLETQQNNAT